MVINQDWSLLPSDLLDHIVQRIVSISDFIRFRSVCTSWRSAAPPQKLRPQPPLLLHPYDASTPYRSVFSPATQKDHHLYLPLLQNKRILASTDGWLLIFHLETNAFSLLNPVTSAQIHLPPASPGSFMSPVSSGLLLRDSLDNNFVVLVPGFFGHKYSAPDSYLLFCRVGDESWSKKETDLTPDNPQIIYFRGDIYGNMRYFIYSHQSTLAFSHQSEPEFFREDDAFDFFCDEERDSYPGLAYDGITEILRSYGTMLFCSDFIPSSDFVPEPFPLYKLDYDGMKITICSVQLKDYAIFNSRNQSIMCCVKDFPHYKEYCLYSTPTFLGHDVSRNDIIRPKISIMDMKDDTFSSIRCGEFYDFREKSKWITLSLL